jgi:aerobic C4-dicarboxylate transport protein
MKSLFRSLFFQVVPAAVVGILADIFALDFAQSLKPLGDGFVRLINMVFAPVIALTIVLGVARMESMKELGGLSLLYFELVFPKARPA